MKTCKKCQVPKLVTEFSLAKGNRDGRHGTCRTCKNRQQRERITRVGRHVAPEAVRRQRLWTWHRLTPERFEEILASQDGACSICGSSDPNGKNWHVDHDHACCPTARSCGNCIRGLLCGRCNVLLGMASDNVETLAEAIRYLTDNALQGAIGAP